MRRILFAQFHQPPFCNGWGGFKNTLNVQEVQPAARQDLEAFYTAEGILLRSRFREVLVPWANIVNAELAPEDKPKSE